MKRVLNRMKQQQQREKSKKELNLIRNNSCGMNAMTLFYISKYFEKFQRLVEIAAESYSKQMAL